MNDVNSAEFQTLTEPAAVEMTTDVPAVTNGVSSPPHGESHDDDDVDNGSKWSNNSRRRASENIALSCDEIRHVLKQVKSDGQFDILPEIVPLESLESDREILRKRCLASMFMLIYVLLAIIAIVVTYSMIQDLVLARKYPARSIHIKKVDEYDAPGLAFYPGNATFLACAHYYNNVVTSKVRLADMDLDNRNCSYKELTYEDPHYPGIQREVVVVRGPTSVSLREAVFLHFSLEDETRDFFTVSYFVFPGYDFFNISVTKDQIQQLIRYHQYVPTFALSAGLRMWIKLIMSEKNHDMLDNRRHTDFRVEYSVVKFRDKRKPEDRKKHLFFIFFEWKNGIIEQSNLVYTTTAWNMGAGLCGVFLMIHRGYQMAKSSYRHFQKDKRRRTLRKRTLRLRSQQSTEQGNGS